MIEATRNHSNAGDGSESSLRFKISELERDLRTEKDVLILFQSQSEVSKFVARQEVEKYRRDCSGLEDRVLRLEEDCKTLRDREVRDRERIKSLLDEIETKDKDFKEKFIALKVEIRDLECGKKRALDEVDDWKKKCEELKAEKLKLVEEISRLKGKETMVTEPMVPEEVQVDDLVPKRSSKEDLVLTPEHKRSQDMAVSDTESVSDKDSDVREDEEDTIPLRQYKRKRIAEVVDGAKKVSGASVDQSTSCGEPCEAGSASEKGTCAEGVGTQTPLLPENGVQEVSGGGSAKFGELWVEITLGRS